MALSFLNGLLSPDGQIRQASEHHLSLLKARPSDLISTLLDAIAEVDATAEAKLSLPGAPANSVVFSPHQMAFVIMRNTLTKWHYDPQTDTEDICYGERE